MLIAYGIVNVVETPFESIKIQVINTFPFKPFVAPPIVAEDNAAKLIVQFVMLTFPRLPMTEELGNVVLLILTKVSNEIKVESYETQLLASVITQP